MNTVITIGRQFGAGGRELGKALAQALGIEYYDRELLNQAAISAGMSPDIFERSDERAPSFISGIFSFNHGSNPMSMYMGSTPLSDERVYAAQAQLIRQLADTRSCVIVGRTADYILRNHPGLISIFVHSPVDARAERIVKRHDTELTIEKARSIALKADRLRANYYNFYTDWHWGQADTYHFSFDSSQLPLSLMVEIISRIVEERQER